MKKLLLFGFGFILACTSSQKAADNKTEATKEKDLSKIYAQTITEEELKEHLFIYASDEFEGRETGQPGQKKAVAYLKKEYEALGIPAAQGSGEYFQKVPLEIGKVPEGSLEINDKAFELGKEILTFSTAMGNFDDIVYVGYGIEDENYNDYNTLDVTNKLVLIKSGEPQTGDGNYVISGTNEKSVWGNMSEGMGKKSELAFAKGAKGVLYFDTENFARYKRYFDFMKTNDSGRMQLKAESSSNFTILLNEVAATTLLKNISEDDQPKNINAAIVLNIESKNSLIDSENVAAIIKGSKKPEEYLIISSHLDHIGITADNQINNGADDDGSGTVALLEIAEAFQKATSEGNGPERSVVFLHVTGEEKGLLGSKYYTDYEPIFPLNNTVANLNIDMIGRIDPKRTGDRNYVYLIGSDKLSTELHELSEEVNKKYTNIEFDYTYNDENDPNRFYYRSDHYNFAKNNIPIIFYFNGTHDDYHRPGDTPDKINYDLLSNRAQLVFHTAWEVANRAERVEVDKPVKVSR